MKYAWLFWLIAGSAMAQTVSPAAQQRVKEEMVEAATAFWTSLSAEQQKQVNFPLQDDERYVWYFFPHERKGLPIRQMTADQRKAALNLLRTGLSAQGYSKATDIMAMENILRIIENRSNTDTYRDPDNYYFTIFGKPDYEEPWSWRIDGHHLSLHFLSLKGRILAQTPTFLGSNPGEVRIDVPQKGKQILKQETERAFTLLKSLDADQRKQAVLALVAFPDIVTSNRRKVSLEKMDGLRMADMTGEQRKLFLDLLQVYLTNYRVTLAQQQMAKLEKSGLDELRFAWAGDLTPELGDGKGWYYRIHGPTILIEYDNTQTNANHVHTVVRDLTNDFGEDLLRQHYESTKH